MEIKKRALFVLSGNLSTTPRALNAIIALKNTYDIQVIGVNRSELWFEIDRQLIKEYNLDYEVVSLQRSSVKSWVLSTIIYFLSKTIYPVFKKNITISSYSTGKVSYLLNKKLSTLQNYNYAIISAYSFGAIFPAFQLANKLKTKLLIDIEDYYPGEALIPKEKVKKTELMKQLLPQANGITYASPLIGKELTKEIIPNFSKDKLVLINNSFSKDEFKLHNNASSKVKFVWFSQTISFGRGLELVIPALKTFSNQVELFLIGNLDDSFYDEVLSFHNFITVVPPLQQKDLNMLLGEFDIGLAIEVNSSDFNRQICLTNKIWAYFQAGLFILATDTPAQKHFLKEHNKYGVITQQNAHNIRETISQIIKNIALIRKEKVKRFNFAKNYSWEKEQLKLISLWDSI